MPSSRGSSWHRDWAHISWVSCTAGGFFTHWTIEEAPRESSAPINYNKINTTLSYSTCYIIKQEYCRGEIGPWCLWGILTDIRKQGMSWEGARRTQEVRGGAHSTGVTSSESWALEGLVSLLKTCQWLPNTIPNCLSVHQQIQFQLTASVFCTCLKVS